MRKKNLLLALILLSITVCQSAFSKPVSVQTAQKIAATFYTYNANANISRSSIEATLVYTRTEADNTVDYYVFDITPKGFVIVSADDGANPILAFSDESSFEPNVPNSGIKDWLDDVANNMNYVIKNKLAADADITSKWSAYTNGQNPVSSREADSSIAPLIQTSWSQSPYYNEYCPGGSVTGCVATAMAQIMNFWQYPAKGTGSYSYNAGTYGTLSADFGATTYDWSDMPAALTGSSTTTQDNAVATLMYQAGVSVAMDYSPSGSGAYVLQSENPGGPCAQYSYINYFGYNGNAMIGAKKSDYNPSKWNIMILTSLNLGRPIEYEGYGVDGGHTWILDGYNSSALAHMNWGWGGLDNGYYRITNLNPSGIPLGSNDGAIFNIVPLKKSTTTNNSNSGTTSQGSLDNLSSMASIMGIESLNVYPVPASNTLNIKYSGSVYSTSAILVSNTLGQTVASYSSVNLNTNYHFDISNYIPGVYFISVISSNGIDRKTLKFIKE